MTKPRRTRTEQLEDLFWDLEFSEKQIVMKNIASLYRQAERQEERRPASSKRTAGAPNGAAQPGPATEIDPAATQVEAEGAQA